MNFNKRVAMGPAVNYSVQVEFAIISVVKSFFFNKKFNDYTEKSNDECPAITTCTTYIYSLHVLDYMHSNIVIKSASRTKRRSLLSFGMHTCRMQEQTHFVERCVLRVYG